MAKRRRKGAPSCRSGEKRFTVVTVDGDPYDSHAARSFERAYALAQPDRGSSFQVWRTCAGDAGEARLPSNYKKKGALIRTGRAKR